MSKTFVWNMKGGRNVTPDRVEKDYYPTPAWATRLLMDYEVFPDKVWEPACGDGAMSEVLKEYNNVVSSDVQYRGYEHGAYGPGADFLTCSTPRGVKAVITNPPFYLGRQFIERASQTGEKAALLLQTSVLGGIKVWVDCFMQFTPHRVYMIRERLEYLKNGIWHPGVFAHAWVVWEKKTCSATRLAWISKEDLK